ncbi:hypothetical protein D3C75_1296550 [compost metagenome]
MAKGKQQLASFTSSFNSIIADTEKQLTANGYSTDVIADYKAAFEDTLASARKIAESLGN